MAREEQIGNARLILGDCREVLPTLSGVDAVVTDPPYGIGENSRKVASRGTSSAIWKRGKPKDYGSFDWDHEPCAAETITMVRNCSQWQIIFGGNFFELPPTSCWLVWDKQNTGDFADCELAWTNLPKAVRRIYWRWNGMIRRGDDEREHPTQKPTGVMRWCIEHLPSPVESILDPFAGSFSTGVAAVQMGKRFTGIEIDPRYYEIGLRRIEQAYRQRDLFVSDTPVPIDPADNRAADLFAEPSP